MADQVFQSIGEGEAPVGFGELVFAFFLIALFWLTLGTVAWAGSEGVFILLSTAGGLLAFSGVWLLNLLVMPKLQDDTPQVFPEGPYRSVVISLVIVALVALLVASHLVGQTFFA